MKIFKNVPGTIPYYAAIHDVLTKIAHPLKFFLYRLDLMWDVQTGSRPCCRQQQSLDTIHRWNNLAVQKLVYWVYCVGWVYWEVSFRLFPKKTYHRLCHKMSLSVVGSTGLAHVTDRLPKIKLFQIWVNLRSLCG